MVMVTIVKAPGVAAPEEEEEVQEEEVVIMEEASSFTVIYVRKLAIMYAIASSALIAHSELLLIRVVLPILVSPQMLILPHLRQ